MLEIALVWVEPWTDAATTSAISWVTNQEEDAVVVCRHAESGGWLRLPSVNSRPWPGVEALFIHTVLVQGMPPGAVYELTWPGSDRQESFRTAPLHDPVVYGMSDFQNAGGMNERGRIARFGEIVSDGRPDLLLLVGDYINDDGRWTTMMGERWFNFLKWVSDAYRHEGAMVPILAGIGNHEARNTADTASASSGGDGKIGPIKQIMTCGYLDNQPDRFADGVMAVRVGEDLKILMLNTDHSVPMIDQIPWVEAQLRSWSGKILVAGHTPAFRLQGFSMRDPPTQAGVMRDALWPVLQKRARDVLGVLVGHVHAGMISPRLTFHPDLTLSYLQNARQWRRDDRNGIRQFGGGPWSATRAGLNPAKGELKSRLDDSTRFLAGIGHPTEEQPDFISVWGEITEADPEMWHVWRIALSSGGWRGEMISVKRKTFYVIEERF
ncbi:metallophosphoesterase family protein [Neomegalonema perideroedes]|uniref:metallophosphoesterase family protein n=1 Tax=Neomegalonema perideroedes TaxID=217219 RepID=UPI00037E7085|nr:metallophosphoesterase [Neomegalonema perideroedes]